MNSGEDMCLRTETEIEKLKHDVQTPHADGTQAMSVIYMTKLEVKCQK